MVYVQINKTVSRLIERARADGSVYLTAYYVVALVTLIKFLDYLSITMFSRARKALSDYFKKRIYVTSRSMKTIELLTKV